MKKITLLLASVALLGACKKDSENTLSKTDLLTARNWRISTMSTAVTFNGQTTTTTTIPSCSADDFTKFNTDKTAVFDEGATKCNSSAAQSTTGSWSFPNNDETKLTVTQAGITQTADIKELTSSTLRIYNAQTVSNNGVTYSYTTDVTYKSF